MIELCNATSEAVTNIFQLVWSRVLGSSHFRRIVAETKRMSCFVAYFAAEIHVTWFHRGCAFARRVPTTIHKITVQANRSKSEVTRFDLSRLPETIQLAFVCLSKTAKRIVARVICPVACRNVYSDYISARVQTSATEMETEAFCSIVLSAVKLFVSMHCLWFLNRFGRRCGRIVSERYFLRFLTVDCYQWITRRWWKKLQMRYSISVYLIFFRYYMYYE